MAMPGRTYSAGSQYRYGFNGQEKSTEIGEGLTTAMFWEYDSRIGRRWNLDPKGEIDESPYLCSHGNPIWYYDPNGDQTPTGVAARPASPPNSGMSVSPTGLAGEEPILGYTPTPIDLPANTGASRIDLGDYHGYFISNVNGGYYQWDKKLGPINPQLKQLGSYTSPFYDTKTGDDYTPIEFKMPGLSIMENPNRVQNRDDEREDTKRRDVFYVTYTLVKKVSGKDVVYTGRTRGYGEMNLVNARKAVAARFLTHHMRALNFGNPLVDKMTRSYYAIRGREQQMIDFNGGAILDGDPKMGGLPFGKSGNAIRGVSKINEKARLYHNAATIEFKEEKFIYTGK